MKGSLALTWKPENIHPATGAYRTNQMLDCWRWEALGIHFPTNGDPEIPAMEVGSFATMTALVKAKRLRIDSAGDVVAA
jgi:hypothetical protein